MAKTSLTLLIVVLFYFIVPSRAEDVPSGTEHNESNMFRTFLKSLANINQERLETVKKLAKLQDPNVMNMLKSGPGVVDENERSLLTVVVMNRTAESSPEQSEQSTVELQSEMNEDINIKREGDDDMSNEANWDISSEDVTSDKGGLDENNVAQENTMGSKNDQENLRMWKGCNKRSAKICKQACMSAHRNVCDRLTCSKKVKKALKKECKSSCKSSFL